MLEIRSRFLTAQVLPEIGACIERLDVALLGQSNRPVLIAPSRSGTQAGDARQSAHFAMLPYVNRVRSNVLHCQGRTISMKPNTDETLALHGVGWQGNWRVLSKSSDHCELGFEAPVDFPFRFSAKQRLTMSENALLIELGITNTSDTVIPVGLGFHPYFPRDAETRVEFNAEWFWLEGPGHLPTDPIRVPPELSFSNLRPLPKTWRANCYTHWSGSAVIDQPNLGYKLSMTASEQLRDLMFYAPPKADFFALEPQSHTTGFLETDGNDSIATPMHALLPGDSYQAWMQLQVNILPQTQ